MNFHFTPFRMKAKAAAHYCGMSETAFRRAVELENWPEGQKDSGGTYWLRSDLEKAMQEESQPIKKMNFGMPI
ncbi:hypothetical protein [Falsihalocynthiibacter sp. CO-5D18]|uniref:hypothetical protein n=1 Tax=Falsihalocynthiibacter sp. CO-5D18 TaxID=3240872 RepID=UPI00350F0307